MFLNYEKKKKNQKVKNDEKKKIPGKRGPSEIVERLLQNGRHLGLKIRSKKMSIGK